MEEDDVFKEFPVVWNSQNFCACGRQAGDESVMVNFMYKLGWPM